MTEQTTDRRFNVDEEGVALAGYSPVSYVDENAAVRGTPEHRVEHRGVTYYLTDDAQVARFTADPSRYEPAFGGWCAFGMSIDKQFNPNPESFEIVDGRLLMFLDDGETDAHALWNQGSTEEHLSRADAGWQRCRS